MKARRRIVGRTMRPALQFRAARRSRVRVCLLERDPPLEDDPTRARHGEQVAVPGGLGRAAGQGAVRAVVVDKLVKADEKAQALAISGAALR